MGSYVGLENLMVLAVEGGFDASTLTTVFNGFLRSSEGNKFCVYVHTFRNNFMTCLDLKYFCKCFGQSS